MLRTKNYPDNAQITHIGLLLKKQHVHHKWSIKVASFPVMLEGAKTENFSALPMLARGRYVNINRVGGGLTASVLSHHRTSVGRIRRFRIDFQ